MSGVALQTKECKNPVLSLSRNLHAPKFTGYAVCADMHVYA